MIGMQMFGSESSSAPCPGDTGDLCSPEPIEAGHLAYGEAAACCVVDEQMDDLDLKGEQVVHCPLSVSRFL